MSGASPALKNHQYTPYTTAVTKDIAMQSFTCLSPAKTFNIASVTDALGMKARELEKFLTQKARIALISGHWFGRQGAGYARMTIACPQSMLKEGLSRLEQAINELAETAEG